MDITKQFPNPSTGRDNGKPYYKFNLESQAKYDETPKCAKQQLETSFISACTPAIMSRYLLDFYGRFLNVHGRRFATTYTPAQLIKATRHHTVIVGDCGGDEDFEWTFTPAYIVADGAFNLYWSCIATEELKIELAITDDTAQLQEASLDDLPQGNSSEFLRLTSDSQLRERRVIEEARIKAKWAQYKAEKAIAKYVERYGEFDEEFLSDDSDQESESD